MRTLREVGRERVLGRTVAVPTIMRSAWGEVLLRVRIGSDPDRARVRQRRRIAGPSFPQRLKRAWREAVAHAGVLESLSARSPLVKISSASRGVETQPSAHARSPAARNRSSGLPVTPSPVAAFTARHRPHRAAPGGTAAPSAAVRDDPSGRAARPRPAARIMRPAPISRPSRSMSARARPRSSPSRSGPTGLEAPRHRPRSHSSRSERTLAPLARADAAPLELRRHLVVRSQTARRNAVEPLAEEALDGARRHARGAEETASRSAPPARPDVAPERAFFRASQPAARDELRESPAPVHPPRAARAEGHRRQQHHITPRSTTPGAAGAVRSLSGPFERRGGKRMSFWASGPREARRRGGARARPRPESRSSDRDPCRGGGDHHRLCCAAAGSKYENEIVGRGISRGERRRHVAPESWRRKRGFGPAAFSSHAGVEDPEVRAGAQRRAPRPRCSRFPFPDRGDLQADGVPDRRMRASPLIRIRLHRERPGPHPKIRRGRSRREAAQRPRPRPAPSGA